MITIIEEVINLVNSALIKMNGGPYEGHAARMMMKYLVCGIALWLVVLIAALAVEVMWVFLYIAFTATVLHQYDLELNGKPVKFSEVKRLCVLSYAEVVNQRKIAKAMISSRFAKAARK